LHAGRSGYRYGRTALNLGLLAVVKSRLSKEVVGTITLGRKQVQPFTNKQISLFSDFAAQATIAFKSTRRERQYRELQSELARANRVPRLISSSLRWALVTPNLMICSAAIYCTQVVQNIVVVGLR